MDSFYIFCDESLKKGTYYSNFYGGLLIDKAHFERVNNALTSKMQDLNLESSELKWSSVNTLKLDAYIQMMEVFFRYVSQNTIKVRVMFTDNELTPQNLKKEYYDKQYHILYYYFIRYAFGLRYLNSGKAVDLEIFFDELPDKKSKNIEFKKFIYGIQFLPEMIPAKIQIKEDSIYEVDSKKHLLLQCLDVVLGSMAFGLNDMHKIKREGCRTRGKRTIAKEKLYKFINAKIREVYPNFNIGITTGINGDYTNRLNHAYRHWIFIPTSEVMLNDE